MATGDQYRRIEPSDMLVFDGENNLVGIRSGKSDSAELRLGAPLTAQQVGALVSSLGNQGPLLSAGTEALTADMNTAAQVATSTAAVSTTAILSFVATQTSRRVRVAWVDLKPPKGATTDATGYAAGAKTITLASVGTGTFYKGDVVTFGGQLNEYTLLAGDSDVSNGGTITLAGYGLAAAIAASATAITLVRRGCRALLALDCDNAVEGLIATQDERQRDAELVLGQALVIQSPDAISSLWASADVSVLSANHRFDVIFGD